MKIAFSCGHVKNWFITMVVKYRIILFIHSYDMNSWQISHPRLWITIVHTSTHDITFTPLYKLYIEVITWVD